MSRKYQEYMNKEHMCIQLDPTRKTNVAQLEISHA